MSKPDDEFKARQNPSIREQMDRPKYELNPDWSEEEYTLVSDIRKIFLADTGTNGKRKALDKIRKYISRH